MDRRRTHGGTGTAHAARPQAVSFASPILAAIGLACIAIPIVIHILFRRRRTPMPWGAMRFLLEAYRRQRRRLALEQWALLVARCLVVALIALGVGGLIFGRSAGSTGPRTVVLVIDNSLVSAANAGDGSGDGTDRTELAAQLDTARSIIGSLSAAAGDRVGIVATGAPARPIVMPPSGELAAAASLLDGIDPTESASDLAGAIALIEEAGSEVVLLSSWREGSLAGALAGGTATDLIAESVTLAEPATEGIDNAAIVRVAPVRSTIPLIGNGGTRRTSASQVAVNLSRSGPWLDRPAERTVRLSLVQAGGTIPAGVATARFAANQRETQIVVPIAIEGASPGLGAIRATIDTDPADADALSADNAARAPLELRGELRVAIIGRGSSGLASVDRFGQTDWLAIALAPRERDGVLAERVDPVAVDRGRLLGYDAIVVSEPNRVTPAGWRAIADAAGQGRTILVFPQADEAAQSWAAVMLAALSLDAAIALEPEDVEASIRPRAPEGGLLALLGGEFEQLAPWVEIDRLLALELPAWTTELETTDGRPLVASIRPTERSGRVIVSGLALDPAWTDLPLKPLVVPLVQELVRQGIGGGRSQRLGRAGEAIALEATRLDPLDVSGDGPSAQLREGAMLSRTGGVWLARDEAGRATAIVALNAPANASNTDTVDRDEALARVRTVAPEAGWFDSGELAADSTTSDARTAGERGVPTLALLMFLLAGVIAACECLLARQASHAGSTLDGTNADPTAGRAAA